MHILLQVATLQQYYLTYLDLIKTHEGKQIGTYV